MKVIDGVRYPQLSDYHAIQTGLWARFLLKKAGRIAVGALGQGVVLAIGLFGGLKIIAALYLK